MPSITSGGASNAWEEIKDEAVSILHSVIEPRYTEDEPAAEPEASMGDKFETAPKAPVKATKTAKPKVE